MWADANTRRALLGSAEAGQAACVAEHALGALANLAAGNNNSRAMWADAETRSVLLAATASTQPECVRDNALRALSNLAMDPRNRQSMGLEPT